MTDHKTNANSKLLQLHIAVLLFGLAGLFGKLISLHPLAIVFGRVAFAALFLFLLLCFLKIRIRLQENRDYLILSILGALLAFHWVSFFMAIQLSTVAIGLLTFSTFPVFVTFLEPVYFKTKLQRRDVLLALITFMGVALIIPKPEFQNSMVQGALWGIASGFSFAVLSLLNKKYVSKYHSLVISFYQDLAAALVLIPFVVYLKPVLTANNLLLLAVLGVVFTGISHSLFISSLSGVRTQTASIAACLEPVYGIIASIFIISEIPGLRVVLGGIVILGVVFYSTTKAKQEHPVEHSLEG